jgi:nucleoside-triphosphatase
MKRLIELLRVSGVPLTGFVTEEIRERGIRVGFSVESVAGERGILAHVDLAGPPRVGKYGVDLPAFERVALPALVGPLQGGVAVIDELGKMELASGPFRSAVSALFDRDVSVVATVHAYPHPFTDGLKERPEVQVIRVDQRNRDELAVLLAERTRV